jgi:3-phosphoshikimate 1-carboxyvinyltransferase
MKRFICHAVQKPLCARVVLPGSKSITNRALVVAALADGNSLLTRALLADDTRLMVEGLRTLGLAVTIDEADATIEVTGCRGNVAASDGAIACGNAGTVMRFGSALAALGHGRYELDGVERMRERPISPLATALQALGAGVEYLGAAGFPPIAVHASGLRGGHISFHAPQSTQFISALLLVAPYARGDIFIEITGPVPSLPYLRLTSHVMEQFGVAVVEQHDASGLKLIVEAPQRYAGRVWGIEPDASAASYFLAAPAVAGGTVTVDGLGTDSRQGDSRFVDVLERMGCRVERAPESLTVSGPAEGQPLRGVDVDLNAMPDTAQTLAVVSLFARGPTVIRNVGNLRIKETDRLAALARELGRLGARVEERADGLEIVPPNRVVPAVIDTYGDHRMAMSFALAGLKCPGLGIDNPECCSKTFPGFFACWERMAATAR